MGKNIKMEVIETEEEDDSQTDNRKDIERQVSSSPSLGGPPDGGWGWVLVLGGGLALSIIAGFNKCVTYFYQALLETYGQSASATASVISISGTLRMISSPFISALCARFSHRTVGMASSLVTAAAYISAALVPSLPYLYFTYAILHGFGVTMFILSFTCIVNMYFTKNRGKANAISTCFIGLGSFYMAPVMSFIFPEYGYTGALVILAGLSLHHIPGAALFRPLNFTVSIKTHVPPETTTDAIEQVEMTHKDSSLSSENGARCENTKHEKVKIYDDDVNLEENQVKVTFFLQKESENCQAKESSTLLSRMRTIMSRCSSVLGLGGLRNLNLCILCFLMASFGIVNTCNVTLLVGLALEKGLLKSQTTIMLSVISAIEVGFRLLSGVLFDSRWVRGQRPLVLGLIAGLSGMLTILLPFIPGVLPTMVTWCLMQGMLGAFQTQTTTVMADLVDRSQITSSYGILRLIQGLGNLIGPLLGGISRDITGSYKYGYLLAGFQFTILSVLFIVHDKLRKRNSKKAENVKS